MKKEFIRTATPFLVIGFIEVACALAVYILVAAIVLGIMELLMLLGVR